MVSKPSPHRRTADPGELVPLADLDFRVLLVLLDGELHGYGIAKEIERREGEVRRLQPTNLYRRLRDLASRGLLEERPEAGGGQRRRLFRVTELGREVAREEAKRLESLLLEARRNDLLAEPPKRR